MFRSLLYCGIVLLPIYPQFSTTAPSLKLWNERARFKMLMVTIESYPVEPRFVATSIDLVKQGLLEAGTGPRRVLFSAHGRPSAS